MDSAFYMIVGLTLISLVVIVLLNRFLDFIRNASDKRRRDEETAQSRMCAQQRQNAAAQNNMCVNCGNSIPPGVNFCPYCGMKRM